MTYSKARLKINKKYRNSCDPWPALGICVGKTWNAKDLGRPVHMIWPVLACCGLCSVLTQLTETFLGRYSIFLGISSADSVIKTSCTAFSGTNSLASQSFLWNLGEQLYAFTNLTFNTCKICVIQTSPKSATLSNNPALKTPAVVSEYLDGWTPVDRH